MTEKRLIDAISLIGKARRMETTDNNGIPVDTFAVPVLVIEDAPTVEAVEVVHGEWRYYSTTMQECSNCQRHTARHKFKYCPHCGAVMEDRYND